MDSGMISLVHKARQYAEEPSRFSFDQFSVQFRGNNRSHVVTFEAGKWHCGCESFGMRDFCSHTMAIERLFEQIQVKLKLSD